MKHLRFENIPVPERKRQALEDMPTSEFVHGEKPFEYDYEFPGGERLEADQDDGGLGHIRILRGQAVLFDAADLLPEGFKLVTPKYFQQHPDEERLEDYVASSWVTSSERKLILLGEFRTPRDFLGLLHEIGHARLDSDDDVEALIAIGLQLAEAEKGKDKDSEVILSEDQAKIVSRMERRAWAWSLGAFRKIQHETKIDFGPIFPSFSDFKGYVDSNLATYRRASEWIIQEGYDPDFHRELERLFDRWKYSRGGSYKRSNRRTSS